MNSNINNETQDSCINEVCPVETALNIIGGKWKGVIIYRLLDGKKRFNELNRMLPKITHRMLTLQLRELERDGIVKRTVYAEVPPKVEYELTNFGLSIKPIISAIYNFGVEYKNLK
ncbi:transcriptional regulator, HxlR family [Clostridium acidisoli DSM 12555]|jgi:DNA-binding HxlR family transcriptional regulator|uniref:Transcriptional regulator, HxlR family n=1 Tax=Clostridium acidisoli DSM 12555 TaxID=1121291 RepID=A0A1W1X7X7_9CLOT|nr:helix-turn-helix domain-containing protein [Clostridium acidisoli]SMC20075.1 transcriptional regulator, HxlR family [Clostridium acidisoli DSM 12555]